MNRKITIRLAKPNEWDAITHLWKSEKKEETQQRNQKKFSQIQNGERVVIFAEKEGRVIGVIQIEFVHPNPEMADGKTIAHIDGLRVLEYERNQGIGKQLMTRAEEIVRERGFLKVILGFKKGPTHDFLWKFYTELGYYFWKEKDDGTTSLFSKELK